MYAHLHSLLEKLGGSRILCVGDVMLDQFVAGSVSRISPEAPIPVMRVERETCVLGGAGNVARNIVSLGGHIDMAGVVGCDQAGYEIAERIAELNRVVSYLITDETRPTTVKTRYVAAGQQLLRADRETDAPLSPNNEKQLLMRVENALHACDVVILSDYAKGVLTDGVLREIISLCRKKDKLLLIDPKGRDFSRYQGAYLLTPNRKELQEATGMQVKDGAAAEKAARRLIEAHDFSGVLAKLGADGVCLVMKGEETLYFRAQAREVYDVSGAGDTVIAVLSLALAGGISLPDAAALANVAGSVVVGKTGTATVTLEELGRALVQNQALFSDDKILTLAQAAEKAERWRKQGLKVGFTNGVFDLLHPGHLSLIRQAHAACDRLIVGMNADASVKRLKGEKRPVQNEDARAAVLASLADVDGVVTFTEDTPIEAIKAIRPDLLVKGADYTVKTVVGADLVQGWGGKILLAKLVDGHSTTRTIEKLKD